MTALSYPLVAALIIGAVLFAANGGDVDVFRTLLGELR